MLDFFFLQYSSYSLSDIYLEALGTIFGLISVLFAKKENIFVFPTGIISTAIYVYLLWKWNLFGDMIVNGYYFVMSLYGWYFWGIKTKGEQKQPITRTTKKEKFQAATICFVAFVVVVGIHFYYDKFTMFYSTLDAFITGIFFSAMWLMAKKKIENWLMLILGDFISIFLFFAKGYTITGFQNVIYTIIAIYAYLEWNKKLKIKEIL